MGKLGGARPGAGRKPKAEKYRAEISKLEKRIVDKLPMLVDRALELADGVKCVEHSKDGDTVYERPPDLKSITYLVDRIAGKPTEHIEQDLTGNVTLVMGE